MDIALQVIFGLIFLGSVTTFFISLFQFSKSEQDIRAIFSGKNRLMAYLFWGGAVAFPFIFLRYVLASSHVAGNVMTMVGGFLLMVSLLLVISLYILHTYKKFDVFSNKRKFSLLALFSLLMSVILFFVFMDGLTYVNVLKFPLPRGIPFKEPLVMFYAICILVGAVLVLFISDNAFYKKYGRRGILENVFYVAFPSGIIGARLWYVIGEWNTGGFAEDPLSIFSIRDGGLAIMGGALLGIIVGVAFFMTRRKEYSITFAVDVIVPTILVAQAIGRWGNFFNQEVYGGVITNMDAWWFLPEFVKRQMLIGGTYRQPFFFIESILNVLGYVIIRFAVGEGLKKYRKPLDLGFLYITWYGLVRYIMEPLRDPQFNMGQGGKWSVYNALVFFIVGVLLIVLNHIFDLHKYLERKVVNKDNEVVGKED